MSIYFLLTIIILSYTIKIIEGPVQSDYLKLENCVWNILVTMTTVGYGDMYPITSLGQVAIIIVSICGSLFTSILTVSLQSLLEMSIHESNAYNDKSINIINRDIQRKGSLLFLKSMNLRFCKKQSIEEKKQNLNEKFEDILDNNNFKKKYEDKYRAASDYNEIRVYFRNTFELLSENDVISNSLGNVEDELNLLYENVNGIKKSVFNMETILND